MAKIIVSVQGTRNAVGTTTVAAVIAKALQEAGLVVAQIENSDGDLDFVQNSLNEHLEAVRKAGVEIEIKDQPPLPRGVAA